MSKLIFGYKIGSLVRWNIFVVVTCLVLTAICLLAPYPLYKYIGQEAPPYAWASGLNGAIICFGLALFNIWQTKWAVEIEKEEIRLNIF